MSDNDQHPTQAAQEKERRVLEAMRKTLGAVVRDTTPEHRGLRHALSDNTISDVKACFALIAARERELNEQLGTTAFLKPHYPDSPRSRQAVKLTPVPSSPAKKPDAD